MQKIFTVYDSKAEAFLPPFFTTATGLALRMFEDCANNPEHLFGRYPGDYTLFELGTFDSDTGQFELSKTMVNLGVAIAFVKVQSTPSPPTPIQTIKTKPDEFGQAELTEASRTTIDELRKAFTPENN